LTRAADFEYSEQRSLRVKAGVPRRGRRAGSGNVIGDEGCRAALDAELAKIVRQGFAVDNEENEADVRCVGAAVFGALGRVTGAISVAAPVFRMSDDLVREVAPAVVDTATDISRSLGAPTSLLDRGRARADLLRASVALVGMP
jgi:hypothetical protein